MVLTKTPKRNKTTLQTSGLPKGIYIIKTTIDGNESIAKLIKE
jgi:hypothetical protein